MNELSRAITETVVICLYQFEIMDKNRDTARMMPRWEWSDPEDIKRLAFEKYQNDPLFYRKASALTHHILTVIERQERIERLGLKEVETQEEQKRLGLEILKNFEMLKGMTHIVFNIKPPIVDGG
jgi:hypothetical protein